MGIGAFMRGIYTGARTAVLGFARFWEDADAKAKTGR
jgi:hypothetical protein